MRSIIVYYSLIIRNKLGLSHEKGENNINVNRNEARYQINITAAEIIFLIDKLL